MESEIDLLDLVKKVWKKKLIIIILTFLSVSVAAVISIFFIKPVYQTNVNIIIGKEAAKLITEDGYTSNDVSMYLQVMKTYEEIAKSRTVWSKVRESLKTQDMSDVKSVNVSSKPETQILTITVTDDSTEKIQLFANTYAEKFIQVANEVLPAGQLKILDKAEGFVSPISPNIKKNLAIAIVIGVAVSLGIIFVMDFVNQFIETEKDLEECFNSPLLCVLDQGSTVKGNRRFAKDRRFV